ncbi:MAG TPA: DUF1552 domain-containing protein [Planctomycetota bacterium]|nr:DUF1552 domain-containing protein [Planctomycetota bacterium]
MALELSRRTFLRGAGVALGLPLLEGMAPARAFGPAPAAPPVRMSCIYFPNGMWEKDWIPAKAGADYELPFALQPLAPHRDDVLVLTGLDKKHSHQGDGHYAKTANFLTGLPVFKTTGKDLSVGQASVDQYCAGRIGHLTPLPSLELGIDPVISGIDSNVGFTRLYGSHISWRSASTPVAREINARLAWQRLFGMHRAVAADPAAARRQEDDRKLLDLVLEDAQAVRGRLGRDDQTKFDEYLDSIRGVEKRIEFFSKPDPRDWKAPEPGDDAPPAGAPGDHKAHVRLMLDLITLAFQTDTTRINTFMFANDVSQKNFAGLVEGAKGAHHEFSHHENKKEKFEPYSKIVRWHVEQLAYLLDRMKAVKEGDRTLLDNSMVMFGSSFSDGNRHDPAGLPILLAGRGGGTIVSGRHLAFPKGTPLCNLYGAMLERMGTAVQRFGDSTESMTLDG